MNFSKNIQIGEILLMDPSQEDLLPNKLKRFTQFLKTENAPNYSKFSFVNQEGSLIGHLTLIQNLLLESNNKSILLKNKFSLDQYIRNKLKNPYLIELLKEISHFDCFPNEASPEGRKITALMQGLLKNGPYLFLDSPEKYLDYNNLFLFIQALKISIKDNGLIVIISSPKQDFWKKYAQKQIIKRGTGHFWVTPIEQKNYHTSKTSDSVIEMSKNAGQLIIHSPFDSIKKNTGS